MEKKFTKHFNHISSIVEEANSEITDFKDGRKTPYKTHLPKLNERLGGGILAGDQIVIAGRSSVGKSAFGLSLIDHLARNYKNLVFLYWSFEMKSWRNILRMYSSRTDLTVKELLSSRTQLSEAKHKEILEHGDIISQLPIYFRDIPVTAEEWESINLHTQAEIGKEYTIVNMVDHTRLALPGAEKLEEKIISNLMLAGIRLKNNISSINIYLSQLNRKIEEVDRKDVGTTGLLPSYIFGADSVFQCADIVLGLHRPEMYGLKQYNKLDAKDLLICQIMKQRDGEVCELAFKHQLQFNRIIENE